MVTESDTLAALLTPLAPGAIAVIGLSGPRTRELLSAALRSPKSDNPPSFDPDRPTLCRIMDSNNMLDEAIVTLLKGKAGEYAEICTHGGVRIAQRVLLLLQRLGANIVEAEPFLRRIEGDANEIEHDIDRALLKSRSRRMTQWLLAQRRILPAFLKDLQKLTREDRFEFHQRTYTSIRLLEGMSVAIVGPPNAGKSTLANRLIGHDRVITSNVPGTTRDWVNETVLIQGWPINLTDTAGVRATDCAIEGEAIRRGIGTAAGADVVIILLDACASQSTQSHNLAAVMNILPAKTERMVVYNKCDLAPTVKPSEHSNAIMISAATGEGVEALEARIAAALHLERLSDDMPTGLSFSHVVPRA